jgi:hypothetical protein
MSVPEIAAAAFAATTAGVVVFQLALALGAPWGEYAMGGAFPGRYPPPMRVAAVLQALLLVVLAGVVLSTAGLMLPQWADAASWLIWGVVAYCVLAVGLNAASRSAGERRIWVPVTVVLLATSLTVALIA